MIEVIDFDDHVAWQTAIDNWQNPPIFAHHGYLQTCDPALGRPILVCARDNRCNGYMCCLLRPLSKVQGLSKMMGLSDTVSPPFGWGGFIIDRHSDDPAVVSAMYEAWLPKARALGIIADYTSFYFDSYTHLGYPGDVIEKMPVTACWTSGTDDQILGCYKKTLRYEIRKLLSNSELDVVIDNSDAALSEFLCIYHETMNYHNASPLYAISLQQLKALRELLGDCVQFFFTLDNGQAVSAELVLVAKDHAFYFRGGTRRDWVRTGANRLLKHRIALWCRDQGLRYYYLGGGNKGADSLFLYKKSFSYNRVDTLRVGTWILDPEAYSEAMSARYSSQPEWTPRDGFFPAYRG